MTSTQELIEWCDHASRFSDFEIRQSDARIIREIRAKLLAADKMRETLKECSDELQAEIDAKYNGRQDIWPSEKKRYQRDIAPITKARAALSEWEETR